MIVLASTETNLEDRLHRYWPELKQRYLELYLDDKPLFVDCVLLKTFREERA